MRSRDEVLIDRFLQNDTFTLEQGEDLRDAVKRMADRIRELEAQVASVDSEREQAFQVAQQNEQTARDLKDRLDRAERLAANAWDDLSRMALAAAIVLREEQA